MSARLRFGIGPLRFSQPLGRTQAQKRAAAKASDQRREGRAQRKRYEQWEREHNAPGAVAARAAAQADHARRTYRAEISGVSVNGVKGGSFTIKAEGREDILARVRPEDALHFLSLKNGDIVQVTLTDDGGLDEFWHLSRANGAKPRNPANYGPGMVPASGLDVLLRGWGAD
jgi:translation initiation factor IF-1